MHRCVFLIAALLAMGVALPPPSWAQWWKEPPASRLDQKVVDPSGQTAARVKWDDGYIEVKAGATADKALALNKAHERSLALDAARQLAYFKLAEIVEGVAIDGVTVVKNAMVADQTVRSTVQARIRGAVVVKESATDLPDGSVWAEVVMGLRLRGSTGLANAVAPWAAARPTDPYQPDPGFRAQERYTGLIVDASDAGFAPALAPRLIEEGSSKVIYGLHSVEAGIQAQLGPVGYAASMRDAQGSARVGTNPLLVRAVGNAGDRKGDLVLSKKDAERLLAADRDGQFLKKGTVVLVLGKEWGEIQAKPGKRHALLVGVNDYRQEVEGAFPRLTYAVPDAQALSQLLLQQGRVRPESLTLLLDRSATREAVVAALKGLRGRVAEDDSVFIYFAGHGAMGLGDDGRPHYFLIPHEGQFSDLPQTALMDDLVESLVGQLPARQVVVVLDTCYSGGGVGTIRVRGVTNRALTTLPPVRPFIEPTSGRVLISASKPDQLSYEDRQRGHGVFTWFLLEGLRGGADLDGNGSVTVLELYQYVSPRVQDFARQSQVDQTPVLEVRGLSGEITLAGRP